MTLQTFLFAVFGKQEKREIQDKKLGMEVLQEIGIQRFVHSLFTQMANSNNYGPIILCLPVLQPFSTRM